MALLAQFVGREKELSRLRSLWSATVDGKFQMVEVIGDAGSGKSRLVEEFLLGLQQSEESHEIVHGSCPAVGGEAYDPFLQILRPYLGQSEDVSYDVVAETMAMPPSPDLDFDVGQRLERLVNAAVSGETGPVAAKAELFSAVTSFFEWLSAHRPLVVVLEDLHWADTATLDLLQHLVRTLRGYPVQIIALRRPQGARIPRRAARVAVQIQVDRLPGGESRELVESVLGARADTAQIAELVLTKAEGNPFYLEEVIRSLVESEVLVREDDNWYCTVDVSDIEVPDTVDGVILARIDQLEERSRQLVQEASVVGRNFQDRLLGQVTELEGRIGGLLRRLEDGDLVRYWQDPEYEEGHEFKHVLTRDVAYSTLLLRRRVVLHERIAGAIERLYRDRLASYAEVLAYHYEQAGHDEEAARYHLMAGEKSDQVYAEGEARRHRRLAARIMGLTSLWSLYGGQGWPTWRVRLAAITTQLILVFIMIIPSFLFVAIRDPLKGDDPSMIPYGGIFGFETADIAVLSLSSSMVLLLMSLFMAHYLIPDYLKRRPSWRRRLIHFGSACLMIVFGMLALEATATVLLRLGALDYWLDGFILIAIALIDTRPVFLIATSVMVVVLSAVWMIWLVRTSDHMRRNLHVAETNPSTSFDLEPVQSDTIRRIGITFVAASVVNFFIGGFGGPPTGLLLSLVGSLAGVGVALWLSPVFLRWRAGLPLRRSMRFPRGLGFEIPMVVAVTFGILLSITPLALGQSSLPFTESAPTISRGSLDRAISLLPNVSSLWHERSSKQEDLDDALADINQAIRLDPQAAESYKRRAYIYESLGRDSEALADVEKIVELRPLAPGAYTMKATIQEALGRYEEAYNTFELATRVPVEVESFWGADARCDASLQIGIYDRAVELCSEALRLSDGVILGVYDHGLIAAYLATGELDLAQNLIRRSGGSEHDELAAALALTPSTLPGFNLVAFIHSLGGSPLTFFLHPDPNDRPDEPDVETVSLTFLRKGFPAHPVGSRGGRPRVSIRTFIHPTEEDAKAGFTLQSDPAAYISLTESGAIGRAYDVSKLEFESDLGIGDQSAFLDAVLDHAAGGGDGEQMVVFRLDEIVAVILVMNPEGTLQPASAKDVARLKAERIREVLASQE